MAIPASTLLETRAAEIAARCRGVRQTATGYLALCPTHDDHDPSLSIDVKDGVLLLHCYSTAASCQYEAILEALGLPRDYLFMDPPPASLPYGLRPLWNGARFVTYYPYTDVHGHLLYGIARYEGRTRDGSKHKEFPVFVPNATDPDGRPSYGYGGKPRVLYRLPHVAKAIQDQRPVYVVEGEKDADVLGQLGLPATCNPGGAGKWLPAYSEMLRGAEVVVLPDNDEPGAAHAAKVVESLAHIAQQAVLLTLPGLPRKGDVSDWLAAGGTVAELEALALGALHAPPAPPPPVPRLEVVRIASVLPEDMAWIWWPYIPRGAIVLLDGDPGIGKSFLTLQLAACLSKGYAFPDQDGHLPPAHGAPRPSLFFALEDSLSHTIRPRVDRMDADLELIYYVKGVRDPGAKHLRQFTLAEPDFLRQALEEYHPLLVVIDPIQAYLGSKVDMYRSNEVRPLMAILGELAEEFDCTFLCLRHLSKSSGQMQTKTAMRGLGSVDFGGIARSMLFVEEHPVDRAKSLLIHVKSNIEAFGRTQVFSKANGQFEWAGVTRLDERVISEGGGREFLRAFVWLEEELRNGLPVPSRDICLRASDHDLSEKTLQRVKPFLGVTSHKVQNFSGDGKEFWEWRLPPMDIRHTTPPLSSLSTSSKRENVGYIEDIGNIENLGHLDVVVGDEGSVGENVLGDTLEDHLPQRNQDGQDSQVLYARTRVLRARDASDVPAMHTSPAPPTLPGGGRSCPFCGCGQVLPPTARHAAWRCGSVQCGRDIDGSDAI